MTSHRCWRMFVGSEGLPTRSRKGHDPPVSYREWEEDPRNRRGRHSAPDGWLASDETNAGQSGQAARRRESPTGSYPDSDSRSDTGGAGSRYSSSGRRPAEPHTDSRGWSAPDRLDDTGAWTRGAHTGEWQQPDEGWPARPAPDSAPPAPYLPSAPWMEAQPAPEPPERSWSRSTEYGDRDGYPTRSAPPRTYGRPALPSAEPAAAGQDAYTGEVLPRGYRTDRAASHRAEPPPPRRAERPAIGSGPASPASAGPTYPGSSYSGSSYGESSPGAAYSSGSYRDPGDRRDPGGTATGRPARPGGLPRSRSPPRSRAHVLPRHRLRDPSRPTATPGRPTARQRPARPTGSRPGTANRPTATNRPRQRCRPIGSRRPRPHCRPTGSRRPIGSRRPTGDPRAAGPVPRRGAR